MDAVVTGGAGFIGSHVADALLARGDRVHVVDNLAGGRSDRIPAGAEFHELDVREARRDPQPVRARAAGGGVPPGRPDRRPRLGREPRLRRRRQRRRHDRADRGGPAGGRADRVLLDRRCAVRRGRHHPLARDDAARADGAVRHLEAVRRELPGAVEPALRHPARRAPLRQRLRAAPGPARRGRRGRDLLRPAGRRSDAADLRRRQADPRLRARGRRGGRQPGGLRLRRFGRGLQRRHRQPRPAWSTCSSAASWPPAPTSRPSTVPARLGELDRSCLDCGLAQRELGWQPAMAMDEGLRGRSRLSTRDHRHPPARTSPSRWSASPSTTGRARRRRRSWTCSASTAPRGTFFVLGESIEGREEILARTIAEGHEIGNHTFSPPARPRPRRARAGARHRPLPAAADGRRAGAVPAALRRGCAALLAGRGPAGCCR